VKWRRDSWLKGVLLLVPVLAGVAVLALQITGKTKPEQAEITEVARPVRFIDADRTTFIPRALAYGHVQPGKVWEAIAQVAGKAVHRQPDLERGRLLEAGSELLRIDPADYELAVARIDANLESIEAQLAEIAVKRENLVSALRIEKRALVLETRTLERQTSLLAKGNTSQASVDTAETAVLGQRQKIQDLESQLNLLPAEQRVLEADTKLRQAELAAARLDLERTTLTLPFDARIAEVNFEETQFVNTGQTLVVADSIDVAEVSAQIAMDRLRPLIRSEADLSSLTAQQLSILPQQLGFSAEVRLAGAGFDARWEARFDRLSDTIDPQTRTVGLIVAVEQPYRKAIPGRRPPLTKNMYVEVELRAPARPDQILIPRVVLHRAADGGLVVYLAGPEDRLVVQPVTPGPVQSDFVVIEEGLEGGERVIVSDLSPAIEGMLLVPSRDERLGASLREWAGGTEAIR